MSRLDPFPGALPRGDRHNQAVRALEDYKSNGTPFVLFLRGYQLEIMHEQDQLHRNFLDDQLVQTLGEGIHVISVQDLQSYIEDNQQRMSFGRRSAGLILADSQWQEVVAYLIASSDLIVMEIPMLKDAMRWELEAIISQGCTHKTVLVVPSPQDMFATNEHEPILQHFPRVVYGHKLRKRHLVECSEIGDLVKRLRQIAESPSTPRLTVSKESPLGTPPISYEGVVEGLLQDANMVELNLLSDGDDKTQDYVWHIAFWNRFRALLILQYELFTWKTANLADLSGRLVPIYVNLAEMCISRHGEQSFPDVREQVDLGYKMLSSAFAALNAKDFPFFRERAAGIMHRYMEIGYSSLEVARPKG